MNRVKIPVVLLLLAAISSCHIFLGNDPDSSPEGIFNSIWTDFDKTYPIFDVKGVDWNQRYNIYSPQIKDDMSDYELFLVCAEMLNGLDDIHVCLFTPFGLSDFLRYDNIDYSDYFYYLEGVSRERPFPPFSLELVRSKYLEDRGVNTDNESGFLYGIFKPDKAMVSIGYLFIYDFGNPVIAADAIPDWVKKINGIVSEFINNTDGLVLDIRNNQGGIGSNMDYIAGRFAVETKEYAKSSTKNGPGRNDFSSSVTWTVKPTGSIYDKRIILLTNKSTVSAGEWFTMAMRTQNHVTHAGEATFGSFSARIIRTLVNGWQYSIPVQRVEDTDGICREGMGITPDEEHIVPNTWDDLIKGKDAQLEYALSFFN